MDKQSFLLLVEKVVSGTATEDELLLYNRYYDHFQQQAAEWNEADKAFIDQTGKDSLQRINQSISITTIPLYNRAWVRIAAAMFIIIAGSFIYGKYNKTQKTNTAVAASGQVDSFSRGTQAILILGNGNKVMLDNVQNGAIAQQGNTRVVKMNDGHLAYDAAHASGGLISTNTLTTPYGGQYQVTLSDGTRVWLNAGSSLRYPTAFTGSERNVALTGEAYFEVAKDPAHPFKVTIKDMEVAVYGTAFNIMGYDEEGIVKTSLLGGSIKLQNESHSIKLVPGQQATMDAKGQLKVLDHPNIGQAVAWKEGLFDFDGADIQEVMRQLCRWYNTEVVYEDKIDQHFTGKISMNADLGKVLQMLQMTEKVRFTLAGKKIIVSKGKQ